MSARIRLETELKKYFPNLGWRIEGLGTYARATSEVSILLLKIDTTSDGSNYANVFVGSTSGPRLFYVNQPTKVTLHQAVESMQVFLRGLGTQLMEVTNQ